MFDGEVLVISELLFLEKWSIKSKVSKLFKTILPITVFAFSHVLEPELYINVHINYLVS